MNEIYREIWSVDQSPSGNGASVASVDPSGDSPNGAAAQVLLDEQAEASGRREIDLATRPLFRAVDADLLARPTYEAFDRLLDNYVVDFRAVEVSTPEEDDEVLEFMDKIGQTDVMGLAFEFVRETLVSSLSRDQFLHDVTRMWFERYTNHFNGRSTHHASGFEHVFVGEGRYRPRPGAIETKGEISGYHSWIKFYRDESAGRVNYLGYKYDLRGSVGPDDPRVVTLQMIWAHQDFDSNLIAQLFKKKGGFFVGSSPEAEVAMGTVAFYQSAAGLVNNDMVRVRLGADGREFDLVIYRNITEDGRRGRFIRSFFPMYLGEPSATDEDTRIVRVPHARRNPGPVFIDSALPNPAGPGDEIGEWVRLENGSDEGVDMTGWELRDRMQRPLPLGGSLAAGEAVQVDVVRRHNGFALGNAGGIITLHDQTGRLLAGVGYPRAPEDIVYDFART